MPQLILVRGIPGSGKTTLAVRIAARQGFDHFEADMWFDMHGGYDPAKIKTAHLWCQSKAIAALAEGRNVIVTNTFIRRWEMQPYIDAAKAIKAEVSEHTCHGCWPNSHGVSAEKVAEMASRFEF